MNSSDLKVRHYRHLKVWERSMGVAKTVFKLTERYPKQQTFGLAIQSQRAAISIPSNIAEGQARDSTLEFLHHISYALGSLAELETQLILAADLGFVAPQAIDDLLSQLNEIGKMLRGLQKSLKAKQR
ncbi:MAG TPA: four helix bundle protein [Pirellulales bacterium]|jgi:four helix bundle protein|nr:four helix bundle protein [Pirellulales bacterium]